MILVTGATGFIGGHLLDRLLADHTAVRALVRASTPHQHLLDRGVEVVLGDVTQPRRLAAATAGVQAVVHLAGLIREPPGITFESVVAEGTRSLVAAAEEAGIDRFIFVSAMGARLRALSRYHRTKAVAEAVVRAGAFDHVIWRPSFVYGPGDELVSKFAESPMPVPGDGLCEVQPVWIGDLIELLVQSLRRSDIVNQTYEVGGPVALTVNEMLRLIARVTGRKQRHLRLPQPLVEFNAWLGDALRGPLYRLGIEPPLTRDLMLLLGEDNLCDPARVEVAFGLRLTPFREALERWLAPAPI